MSIIEAYNKAWEDGDTEALANIIHDDCVFNPHVGGITMSKSDILGFAGGDNSCLLYTSPSPRDRTRSRMPSSA